MHISIEQQLVLIVTLIALVACQSNGAGDESTSVNPSISPVNSNLIVAPVGGNPMTVTDAANGTTIRLAQGEHVTIVLGSTYWRFTGSSDASVVAAEGDPQFQSMRSNCVPGGGCGGVTQSFVAAGAGQAQISAERIVCGEVLACAPNQLHFSITIIVGN